LFMVWPTLVTRMAKGRQAGRQADILCHAVYKKLARYRGVLVKF